MDELKNLESMGLVLPTPTYIFAAILFGIIGYLSYRRGRKISRPALVWLGITLMLYPYAVSQTWLLCLVGAGLCAWVYVQWN